MADPIGAISLGIGAISLGIQVCSGLIEYYKSWKHSSQDVAKMCQSLARIKNMFISIKNTIEREQIHSSDTDQIGECITSCTEAINDLNTKLKKFRDSASRDRTERAKKFAHRLQYPFEKSTLLEMKADVSAIRADLLQAMMVLDMKVSFQSDSKIDDLGQHIKQNVVPGIEDIQIHEDNRRDREDRNAVMAWLNGLSPSTFTDRQNASLKRRKKNTGAWIFREEEMKRWLDGTTPILWCSGDPGCGKSVLMYVFIPVQHAVPTYSRRCRSSC